MPKVTKMRRGELGKKKSTSTLSLPQERNVPPDELHQSLIMLYGDKGIGKTTLANEFPDPFTLMFERGRRNLSIFQKPEKGEPSLNWESAKEYINLFIESDFQTLNNDTIDGMYEACFKHVCSEDHDVSHPQEAGRDAPFVWEAIASEFAKVLSIVQESGKGMIFLSHSKVRPLQTSFKGLARDEVEETEQTYDRLEPTCKPAALRYTDEVCDFYLFYGYREGKRTITVRSPYNIHYTAGGIKDRFLDPDGNPINCFIVGNSPTSAYEDLIKAYNNELYDIDYIPPRKERVKTKKKLFKKRS